MAKKKNIQKSTPKVNPELEGFDIRIDRFGEIKTNYNIDKINEFLNKNVDDKKLRDRDGKFENADEDKIRSKIDKDEQDDDELIEDQIDDMVEGQLDEEQLDDDLTLDEDFRKSDDYDDFSIEDDEEEGKA